VPRTTPRPVTADDEAVITAVTEAIRRQLAARPAQAERDAYSVAEFCARYSISRASLYNAWSRGEGPARMRVGGRVLITKEAGTEWARQMERAAS
jgi:predicted DNA-binding transcriptional regulator AlpA